MARGRPIIPLLGAFRAAGTLRVSRTGGFTLIAIRLLVRRAGETILVRARTWQARGARRAPLLVALNDLRNPVR